MSGQSQISATISATTRNELDRFIQRHGLKKNFVVEQALLYYMQARRGLPDEALTPARLILEPPAFDRLVDLIENPPPPTGRLREMMHGYDD